VLRSCATYALSHCLTLSITSGAYQEVVREFPAMAATVKKNVMKDRVLEGVCNILGWFFHSPKFCVGFAMTCHRSSTGQ
jgi:hypothetical protein